MRQGDKSTNATRFTSEKRHLSKQEMRLISIGGRFTHYFLSVSLWFSYLSENTDIGALMDLKRNCVIFSELMLLSQNLLFFSR